MATPTAMKHTLSQQGRTPSQQGQGKTPNQSQCASVATPPVSTPFSAMHAAAFSPRGPRSSPQHFKKSPGPGLLGGSVGHGPLNYDSPAVAAAAHLAGALDLRLDNALPGLGSLGVSSEDDRARRLDECIAIISRAQGVVSEAGLERLAKRLDMECMWEEDMSPKPKRTLIIAKSALELLITFSRDVVVSVNINFPLSNDVVNKHADDAAAILFEDLKLAPGQTSLTKQLGPFSANFESLANLDKLSIIPGLNLYEAVAGVHQSLDKIHQWEMQRLRQDSNLAGKTDVELVNVALCLRSGVPAMNAWKRVGLSLAYWREHRLLPPFSKEPAKKVWRLLVTCASDIRARPVRVSDKWISSEVIKVLPNDLQGDIALDWQEPEETLVPPQDPNRLFHVAFHVTFDPPVHVSYNLWGQLGEVGLGLPTLMHQPQTYDSLVFPTAPSTQYDPAEPRLLKREQSVHVYDRDGSRTSRVHRTSLHVYKPILGYTLSEASFSHPQQLVNMLPCLRQYAFLARLLENSFGSEPDVTSINSPTPSKAPAVATRTTSTITRDDLAMMLRLDTPSATNAGPVLVDVVLTVHPVPRLEISFPFRNRTASVLLEVHENGAVHVENQDVLDADNSTSPDGQVRRPDDLARMLETWEHIGKWAEYLRTRWA